MQFNSLLEKAYQMHMNGDLEQAHQLYIQILKSEPKHLQALDLLGLMAYQTGQYSQAEKIFLQVIQYYPEESMLYNHLGLVYQAKREFEKALSSFNTALEKDPLLIEAMINSGNIYSELNQFDMAFECYQSVLNLQANHVLALSNLALLYGNIGKVDRALDTFQAALKINDQVPEVHYHLSVFYRNHGNYPEAIDSCQRALKLQPQFLNARINLGLYFQETDCFVEAEEAFMAVAQAQKEHPTILLYLGMLYEQQGLFEKAKACFETSSQLGFYDESLLKNALCTPIIYQSTKQLHDCRKQTEILLKEFANRDFKFGLPLEFIGQTIFYFSYQGFNDLELNRMLEHIYRKAYSELNYSANYNPEENQKIKIGFISKNLASHSVGYFFEGLIKQFSSERFETVLFTFSQLDNYQSSTVILLPQKIIPARNLIEEQHLDILYYLDIGMDNITYFLAFNRLAPIQCVASGHPVTTGLSTIDYYISWKYMEPENAQEHYQEKLILMEHSPTFFKKPTFEPHAFKSPSLPEGKNILCPQNLMKFHPDFDQVILAILSGASDANLIIPYSKYKIWNELLNNRWKKTLSTVIDRIYFWPFLPRSEFFQLIKLCVLMIDPFPFGGGTTTYFCLSTGIPIVCLQAEYMRGRVTAGTLEYLGLQKYIASDVSSYIDLAIRLLREPKYYHQYHQDILNKVDCLYENQHGIKELETVLLKMYDND